MSEDLPIADGGESTVNKDEGEEQSSESSSPLIGHVTIADIDIDVYFLQDESESEEPMNVEADVGESSDDGFVRTPDATVSTVVNTRGLVARLLRRRVLYVVLAGIAGVSYFDKVPGYVLDVSVGVTTAWLTHRLVKRRRKR